MANGSPPWHEGIPSWAKTFTFLIGTVGCPIVVASFFMLQSAGYVQSVGGRNTSRLDLMLVNQDVIMKEIKMDREDGKELLKKLTLAMRIMCKNNARTNQDVMNCEMIQ